MFENVQRAGDVATGRKDTKKRMSCDRSSAVARQSSARPEASERMHRRSVSSIMAVKVRCEEYRQCAVGEETGRRRIWLEDSIPGNLGQSADI